MSMDILLFDLLDEMELTDRARGLTTGTIKKNRKMLRMFFQYLDEEFQVAFLSGVQPVHIKKFMNYKKEQGCAESYVNVFLRTIRALFSYAENEEYITQLENPSLRIRWMKEQKKMVKAWSDTDVEKMLAYTDATVKAARKKVKGSRGIGSLFIAERDRLLIMLLADTGMRICEVENLKSDDFTKKDIFIRRGKGKKDRVVYTSPKTSKQKFKYERVKDKYFSNGKADPEPFLFVNRLGNQLTTDAAEIAIKKIGVAAGCDPTVRMSPHTFRHYFTQTQLDLGSNLYDIQRLLGHSSIRTTETYLRSISSSKLLERGLANSPLMNLGKKK